MAKMITRTIKVYTYVTGTFNPVTRCVENIKQKSFPYKLGKRDEDKLARQNGGMVLSIETGEALYGMTLEDFMAHAKPVSKEQAEGLEPTK